MRSSSAGYDLQPMFRRNYLTLPERETRNENDIVKALEVQTPSRL